MLVLTRKIRESIRVDDNIEVVVLAVSGRRVRLGIECPDQITIDRAEVRGRRQCSQARSSTSPATGSVGSMRGRPTQTTN